MTIEEIRAWQKEAENKFFKKARHEITDWAALVEDLNDLIDNICDDMEPQDAKQEGRE